MMNFLYLSSSNVKSRQNRRDQVEGILVSVRSACIPQQAGESEREHEEGDELLRVACPPALGPLTASSDLNFPLDRWSESQKVD